MDSALEELKRLDRTFGDFLRYAREPAPDLRPADVNRLVEESLEVVADELRARRVTPVLQLDRRAGPVLVDESLFRQGLLCLLQNVIGTLEGGTVTVQTRMAPGAARDRRHRHRSRAPPETAARIFESYFTSVSGSERRRPRAHAPDRGAAPRAASGTRGARDRATGYSIALPVRGAR